jgi:glycerol-3-phosphate dehydrogenase
MTLRQRQQLLDDANEFVEASPHTRVGGTGAMTGDMVRVRDRVTVTEAMKPGPPPRPTPEQLAGEAGLAEYNRIQERKASEEKERLDKLAARKRQEAEEAAAASLRAMYIIEGATADEIRIVDNLMRRAGKYGDVVAHQAKLQNLRWTMEG